MRRAITPLRCILDEERPDLVHLHNIQYYLGPSLLPMLQASAPVIQTVHDARAFCPRWTPKVIPSGPRLCCYPMGTHCVRHGCYPFHRTSASLFENMEKFLLVGWEMLLMRKLDRILAPSAYMREQLRLNGFPEHRLETLPPFLSTAFPLSQPDPVRRGILFSGRIEESKGIRPFLECLALIKQTAWTAQVAGTGTLLAEARAIADRQGLSERVAFVGHLSADALAHALATARILVMPSLMPESFGLAGLEAMAHGTPVVAFDSGGIAEWLKDGETGFRVPWGDVPALAMRVRQLLEDDELAQTLGRQGQHRAQQFDRERHVKRLCEIYAEVTANHPGTAVR